MVTTTTITNNIVTEMGQELGTKVKHQYKMKSIYTEQAEVGTAINRVKDNQDKVLDKYDPTNEKLKKLMLELVQLEKELDDLDGEYEALLKTL
jgi:predicted nuclease with TOPRIM domain